MRKSYVKKISLVFIFRQSLGLKILISKIKLMKAKCLLYEILRLVGKHTFLCFLHFPSSVTSVKQGGHPSQALTMKECQDPFPPLPGPSRDSLPQEEKLCAPSAKPQDILGGAGGQKQ